MLPDSIIFCRELHWAAQIKATCAKSATQIGHFADMAEMELNRGQGHFLKDVPPPLKLIIHQRQTSSSAPNSSEQ